MRLWVGLTLRGASVVDRGSAVSGGQPRSHDTGLDQAEVVKGWAGGPSEPIRSRVGRHGRLDSGRQGRWSADGHRYPTTKGLHVRVARFAHQGGMSFGVVEGE